jgi:hypothetical protein
LTPAGHPEARESRERSVENKKLWLRVDYVIDGWFCRAESHSFKDAMSVVVRALEATDEVVILSSKTERLLAGFWA